MFLCHKFLTYIHVHVEGHYAIVLGVGRRGIRVEVKVHILHVGDFRAIPREMLHFLLPELPVKILQHKY